jgi:hypothetical protein
MSDHDRLAAHDLIHRWWFNYDEGNLAVLEGLLTEDCHTSSRTELGTHPYEDFIRSDCHGPAEVMTWKKEHRRHSPYPLRHHAANVHVVAERGDELDLASYLFVTQIVDRQPSPLSSGLVHWTLVRGQAGYLVRRQDVVLDSIESAPFCQVEHVSVARRRGDPRVGRPGLTGRGGELRRGDRVRRPLQGGVTIVNSFWRYRHLRNILLVHCAFLACFNLTPPGVQLHAR